MNPTPDPELNPVPDAEVHEAALERHRALAAGMLVLPNLFLRSALTLFLLYGMLGLILITLVELDYTDPTIAVGIGVVIVLLQFVFSPWILDLIVRWLRSGHWVQPEDLPDHLREFVQRVCEEERIRFPSFAIIDDGAPEAFTYGHHPSNARVVISRGIFELLTPAEVEAVVAHEIGHVRNWDMALMTLANLVPLLLYYLYRVGIRLSGGRGKGKGAGIAVAVGAYLLYIVSEYIVLWFSRTREYYADRFAGQATGNPSALASALVKIAYGLAAQDAAAGLPADATEEEKKKARKARSAAGTGALAALNIFDRGSALSLVMSSSSNGTAEVDPERVKGAMQWDLWNPWAAFYELHSTHPLTAKRLLYLSDQAAAMDKPPYVVFDRKQPESYWDDFFLDLGVVLLPYFGLLAGIGAFLGLGLAANIWLPGVLGVAVVLLGLGMLVKYRFVYPRGPFENLTVASLMHKVKVSPVRPVTATLTGKIIGKGVPGLVYSEDFVVRDSTGILFLDYQQPLGIWNFLFGLLRAGRYQGKEVRVRGWFRRAPIPYMQIDGLEVLDGDRGSITCYTSYVNLVVAVLLIVGGAALTAWLFVAF